MDKHVLGYIWRNLGGIITGETSYDTSRGILWRFTWDTSRIILEIMPRRDYEQVYGEKTDEISERVCDR